MIEAKFAEVRLVLETLEIQTVAKFLLASSLQKVPLALFIRDCGPENRGSVRTRSLRSKRRRRCSAMQSSACWIWIKAWCADTYPPDIPILQLSVLHLRAPTLSPFPRLLTRMHTRAHPCVRSRTSVCVTTGESKIRLSARFDKPPRTPDERVTRSYDICMKTIACSITGIPGRNLNYASCPETFSYACVQEKGNFAFLPSLINIA